MSRRKLLLNRYERAAHKLILDGAKPFGAEVFSKVRLADVLRIKHSGISDEQYKYALMSHFDFVVAKDEFAHFAIEFDGPQHISDSDNMRNDRLKKEICDHLDFPLIRIDSQFLRPVCEKSAVLSWLVSMWFKNQTFSNAACNDTPTTKEYIGFFEFKNETQNLAGNSLQDAAVANETASVLPDLPGSIEYDTTRDPFSAYRKFYFSQVAEKYERESSFHNGRDKFGYALSCAVFRLDEKRSLVGRGRTQTSDDWPVCNKSVASDLACLDLFDRINLWLSGETRVVETNGTAQLVKAFTEYQHTGAVIDPKTFVGLPEFVTSRWL